MISYKNKIMELTKRIIKNHKWICECGAVMGEEYEECPLCKYKKEKTEENININKVKLWKTK
mgnify:FL=1